MTEFDELIAKIKSYARASFAVNKPQTMSKGKREEMLKALEGSDIPADKKETLKKVLNSSQFPETNDMYSRIQSRLMSVYSKKSPNPPITAGEMEKAEKVLGFGLPNLLRRIYLEVGNGGFGPGAGLLPIQNKSSGRQSDESIPSIYAVYLAADPECPQWKWPRGMLPFCDWGDTIHSCIDCLNDPFPVYRADPELLSEGDTKGLRMERPSLYQWLIDMVEDRVEF